MSENLLQQPRGGQEPLPAAYFNTTKGVLAGRPSDEDFLRAKEALDQAQIAYLYAPDATTPRPMFFMRDRIVIGAEAIAACIGGATAAPT